MSDIQDGQDGGAVDRTALLDLLPSPDTRRWVARRKAEVVNAVRQGLLSLEAACARYQISEEEFISWERLIDRHGLTGLRVTHLKRYRRQSPLPGSGAVD
jgi:Protein of unknown function (DUF1153)